MYYIGFVGDSDYGEIAKSILVLWNGPGFFRHNFL